MGSSRDRDLAVRTLCLNEPAAAGIPRRSRFCEVLAFLLLAALTLSGSARAQTPVGTPIPNTGFATYDVGTTLGIVRPSNTLTITTAAFGTPSSFDFMRYAPGAPGATAYAVTPTACFNGVAFNPLPAPNAFGGGPIALGSVDLVATPSYHAGEPIFVRVVDPNRNLNPAVIDNVVVNLAAASAGDTEQLQLQETGVSTGVFVGYIPSSAPPAPANNCVLAAPSGQTVTGSYVDPSNAGDTSTDSALINPESRVFDSSTGGPVSGAQVTLIDDATGLPATTIRGDDGTSSFPATVTSGGSVTDGGGTTYNFGPGGYRFPIVPAGTYHLQVTPPANYAFPSVVPDASLQILPGAPFNLSTGSRGAPFTVVAGPTFSLDVPLDAGAGSSAFISIQPSREVVSIGDHLQFDVRVSNPGAGGAPGGVTVTVVLPLGFRYTNGSTRIDDAKRPDPSVSPDGRTLTWTLPVTALPQVTHIRFTVGVATGTQIGPNRTKATAAEIGGTRTSSAVATVRVDQEMLGTKAFILGRVSKGTCDDDDFGGEAVAGARVYLEDGTYSVTDSNGYYHFEGLRPGTHVVQLDLDSLPAWVEPLPCPGHEGHLFAGRPFSQFADLQGGTLWRNDFRVQLKPQRQGAVNQRLESQREGDVIHYQLALNGTGVGLRNTRALVMLPDGVEYVPGSTKNRGAAWPDPQVDGNALTYRLGDELPEDWSMELTLDARAKARAPDLETKSVVLFDTPNEKSAKTPIALNQLQGESSAGSGMQVVETLGLRPGEEWKKPDAPAPEPPKPAVYNKTWLEQATPGFEWLSPESGFAPPIASVHIAIKHEPDTTIELTQNGELVSRFNFEGTFQNKAHSVSLSRWRGVDLVDGDNQFVAKEVDADGKTIASIERLIHYAGPPFQVELLPEQSVLVADGRTTPVIAVRLIDKDGKPAREGVVGTYEVEPPYQPKLDPSVRELRRQAGLAAETPSYRVGADGIARIELTPTTVSGKSTFRFMLAGLHKKELHPWLEAEARDWVLVGLTGGTLAHTDVSQHMESIDSGAPSDGFSLDRGTSFFAKGRVKGSWLLTAAYDSQREKSEADALFRKALDGGIDPNQYYTLYGDTSEQRIESPSQRPLYLKLERKQFFALFGDYTTGLTTTELSRYNRSLNGLHSEYESDHFAFSAFGTDTNQAFVRDEIRGDGTSGLYQLSRQSIVVNSEKVRLETRDRFNSADVVASQPQARYVDYNIDYQAGTIFFKQPIPSHGDGFDPLFIVVEYESEDGADQRISGGGRGAVKLLDDRVELGATGLHEGTVGRTSSLYGSDVRIDLDDSTRFRGEYAATHSSLLDPNQDGAGGAWLAELTRRDAALDTRAYYREQQAGFGIGQQAASETSTRKMGVDARYLLSDTLRLSGQAFRESDLASSASRDVFEARADRHDGPLSSYGGFRWAHDQFSDGTAESAPQVLGGASYLTFGGRLKLRGDTEVNVGGGQSLDFPTRFLVGADYELLPNLTLFGEEELSLASVRSTTSTRVGLRTSPWQGSQVSAAIGQRSAQDAQRLFTTIGALQTFQLTDAWSFDFGVDNSITLKGQNVPADQISPFGDKQPVANGLAGDPGGDDFTSISLGTTYAQNLWAANLKVETRQGSARDKWGVTAGAYRQLADGVGVALRAEFFDMAGQPSTLGTPPTYSTSFDSSTGSTGSGSALSTLYGVQSLGRLRFSAVYRPIGSRYILLDSTEFRRELLDGDLFGSRSNRIINNANLNVKLDPQTQISFQYGAKYLLENMDSTNLSGYTDVTGVELRRDIWGGFDLGARVALRHSWSDGATQQLYSASLGYIVAKNLWVTAGYNFGGYRDRDFSGKDWTSQGPFITFKYKFDQQTVKELLEWGE